MPTLLSVKPGKTDYDFLVFIGRFQPFHNGHKRVIDEALKLSKKVIVLIGSSDEPRSHRNPFTYDERRQMITEAYDNADRIIFAKIQDYPYNDQKWVAEVQKTVSDIVLSDPDVTVRVLETGLIGCEKDHTSFYLKLFPQWGNEAVEFLDPLNATDIRNAYFASKGEGDVNFWSVPASTANFLVRFATTEDYKKLVREYDFVKDYKQQWEGTPYPVTFVTVDAVVIQSGHVLLVKRAAEPGKGQLAMPGGFINQNELLVDAAIRELKEETKIGVPVRVLKGNMKMKEVFDHPNRSSRGRTITHAFLFKLDDAVTLEKVKGSDDAEKAMWVPLGELDKSAIFEDHYHIIQEMIEHI